MNLFRFALVPTTVSRNRWLLASRMCLAFRMTKREKSQYSFHDSNSAIRLPPIRCTKEGILFHPQLRRQRLSRFFGCLLGFGLRRPAVDGTSVGTFLLSGHLRFWRLIVLPTGRSSTLRPNVTGQSVVLIHQLRDLFLRFRCLRFQRGKLGLCIFKCL